MLCKKNILKSLACLLLITYCSTIGVNLVWASDQDFYNDQYISEFPLLAQVFTNRTPAQETAQRKERIYDNKAQRIDKEISEMTGSQELLLDVMVTSAFVGAGLLLGSNEIEKTINSIELEPENTRGERDKENALNALQSVEQVGWGIAGVSLLSTIGYLAYEYNIYQKEQEKKGFPKASSPRTENDTIQAINEEINSLEKAQRVRENTQHAFSSIAIGSLLTGGLLWAISGPLRDNVEDIEIDDNDIVEEQYRCKAIEAADGMENWGKGLVITGAVSWGISIIAGFLADSKEEEIHDLENGLLRADELLITNHHIDITPQPDGFTLLYSYNF
ncbi:MAG: hypothetical protein D3905_04330 [Candidatus Electrothrix sp. AS4_5]|nr:hypothetical protein [Candidatus Electrothrix gigas]